MSSLEHDIGDYFRIEKEKWEIVGLNLIMPPFMILIKKMRLRLVFPLSRALPLMTYPSIPLERRIIIFPCMKKDSWK